MQCHLKRICLKEILFVFFKLHVKGKIQALHVCCWQINDHETTTWEARLKFGPGERFLFGTGGALLAPLPEFEPLRFRRLFGGLCASVIWKKFEY